MSIKIGIITTQYLHKYLEDSIKQINPDCEWEIYQYENFRQLPEIFKSAKDKVDGFIVSGHIVKEIILRTNEGYNKSILSLSLDLTSLYQFLIKQLLENRSLDIDRLLVDFFISIDQPAECSMLLDSSFNEQISYEISNWFKHASLEEIFSLEDKTKIMVKKLYEEKKADMFICFYSSLMNFFEENKLPCLLAFPDLNHISILIKNFILDLTYRDLQGNKPVVILIKKRSLETDFEREWGIVSIHKCMLDYNREKMINFLVKRADSGVEIYTNKTTLDKITNEYSTCELSDYLEKKLDFKINIGYGIGEDIIQAQSNATIALKNSTIESKSFVVDENQNLIGPLNTEQIATISLAPSDKIKYLAEKAKLSTVTIEKLLYVIQKTGSNQISVNDLVLYLGGTIRNANRILNNLEKNGLATVNSTKSNLSTGRPVKVYQINKELSSE